MFSFRNYNPLIPCCAVSSAVANITSRICDEPDPRAPSTIYPEILIYIDYETYA